MIKKKFISTDVKYDTKYLYTKNLESYNSPILLIYGPRGIGKTFHFLLEYFIYCIEHSKKLVYVVETQKDIDELSMNNGEKFFGRIIMELKKEESARKKKHLNYFVEGENGVTGEVNTIKDGKSVYEIKKGIIKINNKMIGYIISLNDFAHLKRNSFDDSYARFIIDEFIPEKVDVRTLDNPRKIVSIIQSIVRDNNNIKIVMLGNSIRLNDPILQKLKCDDLIPGEIRTISDNKGLLLVSHRVNRENYPLFIERTENSIAGRLATFMDEDNLDRNEFKDDEKIQIIPNKREKSVYVITLFGRDGSLRIHRTNTLPNKFYVLENYTTGKSGLICIDYKYQTEKIIYDPDWKETLINIFKSNKIFYANRKLYFTLKSILGLELK